MGKYSKEELENLYDLLHKEHTSYYLLGHALVNPNPSEYFDTMVLSSKFIEGEVADLFRAPLEEMPRFINHFDSKIRVIATWRLKVGK